MSLKVVLVLLVLLVHAMRVSYSNMTGKLKTSRCEAVDAAEIEPAIHVSSLVLSRSIVECLAPRRFCEA